VPRCAGIERCGCLDVNPAVLRHSAGCRLERRAERILPEGRIEENNIERGARAAQIRERVIVDDLHLRHAQELLRAKQRLERSAVVLDKHDPRRAARGGLEAERAAAGEEIQTGEAVHPLAQPVEQRLPHAIRGRTNAGARGHRDAPAAMLSSDDSHGTARRAALSAAARIHASMVAALSWAARLKAGLARTREVLNTPVSELFTRRTVDESLYEELETALLQADCGVAATQSLLAALRKQNIADGEELKAALKRALTELLSPLEKSWDVGRAKPFVVMIAGVNGSGKTTSIGKIAKWLQDQGKSLLLAAGDTFRAAAREQLMAWGERNGVAVIAQQSGDAGAVVFDALSAARARGIDVVLADTAGRLPTQLHLMEEIRKVKRVAAKALEGAPHDIILVLDANTGQNALAQVKAFDDALGLTGLVVTKLDGTAKGGMLCAIAHARSTEAPGRPIPVLFIGVGEGIEDLRPFVARDFAEALVG
jgi:fused signal recognition particle receptor